MQPKPNLDFMRAVAVLLVVLDHTMIRAGHQLVGWVNFGYVGVFGVYLFFVHTCLVLMWSLERRPHTLDFYIRRIFRIYPLSIVVVSVIVLFRLPLFNVPVTKSFVMSNLLLVQNLWSRGLAEGVLWSLPLEVQMYLVLPVLFAFVFRERTRWPLLVLWLFVCRLDVQMGAAAGWDSLPGVVPNFIPGVIAYVGFMKARSRLPAWSFALFLGVLLAWYSHVPSVKRGWIACLALGLALPYFRQLTQRTVAQVSHVVAKYSYSIYLLHSLALMLAFEKLARLPLVAKLGVEFVSLAVLAALGYHLVERPMIEVGARVAAKAERILDRAEGRDPVLAS
jgi:peptidoglycan/LPS O-acetylase OafA/YrhL